MTELITIGVDESGTGAWAGPFTVCALAGYIQDSSLLVDAGIRDSKKLSDARRRDLCGDAVGYALSGCIAEVSAEDYNKLGHVEAWRQGMREAISTVVYELIQDGHAPSFSLVIDGNSDPLLATWLRGLQRDSKSIIWVRFIPKADDSFAFVSAASILAKTRRNDLMIELDEVYSEYGWIRNMGYGSAEHQEALKRVGKSLFHRDMTPMRGIPLRED